MGFCYFRGLAVLVNKVTQFVTVIALHPAFVSLLLRTLAFATMFLFVLFRAKLLALTLSLSILPISFTLVA